MVRAAEELPVEERLLGNVGAHLGGQAGKSAARSLVVRPHRGFKIADMRQILALQEFPKHGAAKAMAASAGVHRNLPDEQDVRAGRVHISGDETVDASSGAFGQDAGVAKVLAQEQVRVVGIQVEWRALGDEAVDRGAGSQHADPYHASA